jgi:hypothetical protein
MERSSFQIDISRILLHEADEPDHLVQLSDSELLTGHHGEDLAVTG